MLNNAGLASHSEAEALDRTSWALSQRLKPMTKLVLVCFVNEDLRHRRQGSLSVAAIAVKLAIPEHLVRPKVHHLLRRGL